MFDPSTQEILAVSVVAVTAGAFVWRWAKNRRATTRGCGGACSCPTKPGK